jgi:acyl-CoA reductase-like NAD-dependent aldehyde dehydrogenase
VLYQAENIATIKLHNAGYNCVSGQVLVLPKSWDQSEQLLEAVRRLMKELPPRQAYYPGTVERQQAVLDHYPEAEQFDGPVPRTLITGLDPDKEQYFFQEEVFGPVLGQVSISGGTPSEFLQNAVRFANEKLQGTLGATIIVHPKTARKMGPVLEAAVADLRYGTVGVNVWNAGAFLLPQAVWGGYPGATEHDIQSGQGFVHNSLMFDKAEKTVLRASFYPFPRAWRHGEFHIAPKPAWFVTNKTAHTTVRRVAKLTTDPHPKYLPGIFISALKG